MLCTGFNLQQWLKHSPQKRPVVNLDLFLTQGKLKRMEITNAQLRKEDADLLGLSLAKKECTLRSLNLSGNNLYKEGAEALSAELAKN